MKAFPLNTNYLVSEKGDIFKKTKYGIKKLKSSVDTSTYHRIWLVVDGEKKRFLVHRVVAITYIDNPENLPQVNHKDGNKLNNDYHNLEWVTAGQNQIHAYENNLKRIPNGELNGRAFLKEDDVLDIYNKLLKDIPSNILAEEYNIPVWHINKIKRKTIWTDLLKDLPDMEVKTTRGKLQECLVREICEKIVLGCSYKEASELITGNFTKDQFYDIRRGRCYPNISKEYF